MRSASSTSRARTSPTARSARCWCAGPAPPKATGTSARRAAPPSRAAGRARATSTSRDADGLLHLPGAHRRHVQGVGHLGVAVRGGERADRPRRRAGSGRGAEGGQRRPAEAQGLHRAEARQDGRGQRPARSAEGAREGKAGPWKYPRWIEFVDSLPKTATGKIQRFKLREA